MADEANEIPQEEEAKGGGMMKMIVLGVIGLVLLSAGVFAGKTFMGGEEPAEAETAEAAEPTAGPAIYQSLHPPLVVNFKDALGDSHFMQITMEVMARDQNLINSLREHIPAIRNALILHYSGSVYEEVTTRAGKEKMLAEGLAEINKVMKEQTGADGIEAAYFTALVIQ
jgi:flagellar FliL protein